MIDFSLKHVAKVFETPKNWTVRQTMSLADSFNDVAHHFFENGLGVDIKGVSADVIKMKVTVLSGTDSSPPEKEQLAHITEHLTRYGTKETQDMGDEFEKRGGYSNAETKDDSTVYEFSIPNSRDNEALLYLYSTRRLFNHDIEERQFENEKEILTTEQQEKQDFEQGSFDLALQNQAFGQHVVRSPESLQRITRDDVEDFMRRHYVASNMKVELSGVSAASAYAGLRNSMGVQPPVAPPPRPGPESVATYGGGFRHIEAHEARQSHVGVAFPLLPEQNYDFRLDSVMSEYLSASLKARLRGHDDRRVYKYDAELETFRHARVMTIVTSARTDKADAILPAVAGIMSDIAGGRIDQGLFATAVAQSRRFLSEYKEMQDYDPRQMVNSIDRWRLDRHSRHDLDAIKPADLTALAKNVMLAQPPTLVTKGDDHNIQSYENFCAMLASDASKPQAPAPAMA